MTAAKVLDIISRFPDCDGQAADAVSAYTQVKKGRCSQIIENSQIGMSRHLDSSTTTQMAQVMVQYRRPSRGRPSRSSWAKSVRSSFGRVVMGKATCGNLIQARLAKILWTSSEPCLNREFPRMELKNFHTLRLRECTATSILLLRKDWHSIRLGRMQSSFKKHFQLIVFRTLLGWKLEKSYTKKYTCHLDHRQRSHWNTNGSEN